MLQWQLEAWWRALLPKITWSQRNHISLARRTVSLSLPSFIPLLIIKKGRQTKNGFTRYREGFDHTVNNSMPPCAIHHPSGTALMARYSRMDVIEWWNDAFDELRDTGAFRRLCEQAQRDHGKSRGSNILICIAHTPHERGIPRIASLMLKI